MISTIVGYIQKIQRQHNSWGATEYVWFRGELNSMTPLLPKLYRPKPNGSSHHENKLLQIFRMRAATFSNISVPIRGHTDQWLFLAQHVGLPTRSLDWTENALLALYFAIKEDKPLVWMLDPMSLNRLTVSHPSISQYEDYDEFALTWIRGSLGKLNIGHENIRSAWEQDSAGVDLPIAIHPTYLHPRMMAQRSVFTFHGKIKISICNQVPSDIYSKIIINPKARKKLASQLRILGIEEATAFPDLDGLSQELSERY